MSHLVEAIRGVTIAACYRDVKEAHDYLAQQGAKAIEHAAGKAGSSLWGGEVKRLRVSLPMDDRPARIALPENEHNLMEVINQCATMERLLDVLKWAQTDRSGLAQFRVECCHPTTSSVQEQGKKASEDNDLVLIDSDSNRARFEISDVVSDRDGNGKEQKDLISLGVWQKGTRWQSAANWPAGRMFLVVSQNFAPRLRRKGLELRYIEVVSSGQTRIFEIKAI